MPAKPEKCVIDLDNDLLAELRRLTRKRTSEAAVDAALREYLGMWRQVVKKHRGKKELPRAGTWEGMAWMSRVLRENGWEMTPRPPARKKK